VARLLKFAVGLCLLLAAPPTVARADDAQLKEQVRTVILAADKLCQWKRWPLDKAPSTRPSEDEYLRAIQPVLEMGRPALPALRELAEDTELTPFQRRLAEILPSRIEQPERFAAVARILQPVRRKLPLRSGVVLHDLSYPYDTSEPPQQIIHPDERKVIARYQDAREKVVQVINKYYLIPEGAPPSAERSSGEEALAFQTELFEIQKTYNISSADWRVVLGQVRIDATYLLPMEELAMRPFPLTWKTSFLSKVIQVGDVSSSPVVGEMLRRAFGSHMLSIHELRTLGWQIAAFFAGRPSRVALVEVSETIAAERKMRPQERYGFVSQVVPQLSRSAKWEALLREMESRGQMLEHVRRVRKEIELFRTTTRPADRP